MKKNTNKLPIIYKVEGTCNLCVSLEQRCIMGVVVFTLLPMNFTSSCLFYSHYVES